MTIVVVLRKSLKISCIHAPRTVPNSYNLGNILQPSFQHIFAMLLESRCFCHVGDYPMAIFELSVFDCTTSLIAVKLILPIDLLLL